MSEPSEISKKNILLFPKLKALLTFSASEAKPTERVPSASPFRVPALRRRTTVAANGLTQRAADAAKARDGKRTEFRDAGFRGLVLIVQPSGTKSWALRYRYKGKPVRLTLGAAIAKVGEERPAPPLGSPLTLAEARIVARDQLAILAAGHDPRAVRSASLDEAECPPTFADLAHDFLADASRKNKHWMDVARDLGFRRGDRAKPWSADNLALADGPSPIRAWGSRQPGEVSRRDVAALLRDVNANRRGTGVNKTLAALRHLFNVLMASGVVNSNPADRIPAPVAVKSRDRSLDDAELSGILIALDAMETTQRWHRSPFVSAMRLLIYTGARLNEIARLRWSEVDLANRRLRIDADRMKMKRPHTIHLADTPMEIVRGLPRYSDTDIVFTTNGKVPISAWGLFKKHLDLAAPGIAPWRLHDLRRAFASGAARLGVPIHVVEKALAHRSGTFSGIVGTYQQHRFERETATALDAWAAHLDTLTKNTAVTPLNAAAS